MKRGAWTRAMAARTARVRREHRFMLAMYIATSTKESQATIRKMLRLGIGKTTLLAELNNLESMGVIERDPFILGDNEGRSLRVLPGWKEKVMA